MLCLYYRMLLDHSTSITPVLALRRPVNFLCIERINRIIRIDCEDKALPSSIFLDGSCMQSRIRCMSSYLGATWSNTSKGNNSRSMVSSIWSVKVVNHTLFTEMGLSRIYGFLYLLDNYYYLHKSSLTK